MNAATTKLPCSLDERTTMQQKQTSQQKQQQQRIFTASEVAEFEYCPLVWWHEQYEPWAQADSEELFARMVELEHENGAQAPALPEYQMIEQLLVRQGAFDEGKQQHLDHAEEVEEVQEERIAVPAASIYRSKLILLVLVLVGIAVLLIIAAIFLH